MCSILGVLFFISQGGYTMLLTNAKYDKILREYDYKQQKSKHDLNLRRQDLYAKIPALEELDQELVSASVQSAKLSLYGDDSGLQSLATIMEEIRERRKTILQSNGYSMDYLEATYDCTECKDTGYVDKKKCTCFKRTIINEIYSQSNMHKILEEENFNSFDFDYYSHDYVDPLLRLTPRENIENVYKTAKNFIEHFSTQKDNLIFTGNPGVGKTFIANCIAKELIEAGHTVIYLTAFQLFDLFEKIKFKGNSVDVSEFQAKFDYILDCDLLIIDDLGTELNNTFVNVQLYLCINERYLRNKSTIISTNYELNHIKSMYSERIFSRIASNYRFLKIIGDDIRFKKLF